LTLIDLAPLVTVIEFFQAPERWLHCFTTKLKIARAATRKRRDRPYQVWPVEALAEDEEQGAPCDELRAVC
jgi:hypothetical protein